jgi:hypothetical protein
MHKDIRFFEFCAGFRERYPNHAFTRSGLEVLFKNLNGDNPDYDSLASEYVEKSYDEIEECYSLGHLAFDKYELRNFILNNTFVVGEVPDGLVFASF